MVEKKICEKCGHEIESGSIICGYCGRAIPRENLDPGTVEKINNNKRSDESLKPNVNASIRGFGIMLMIIGGICDVVCLFLIGSGSFESFHTFTIIGTITFLLGLFFTFAFRGY